MTAPPPEQPPEQPPYGTGPGAESPSGYPPPSPYPHSAYPPPPYPPPPPYGGYPPPPPGYPTPPYAVYPPYPPPYPAGYWPPPTPYGQPMPPAPTVAQAHPHEEPTPYHRMYRTWGYRWWRPVVGLIAMVASFVIVAPALALPVLFIGVLFEGTGSYSQRIEDAINLTNAPVTGLLYLNVAIALLTPIVWLLVRTLHRLRPRWVSSVRPRIRWLFLLASFGMAFVTLVVTLIVSTLIPASGDQSIGNTLNPFNSQMVLLLLVVLFTTPLQAIGEEMAFRGYLVQAFGSLFKNTWLRSQWFPVIGSALLFAAAHGSQNLPLFFDRFAFGFVAAWLVIRTGGLEAGIAMHILNNFLAFGAAIFFGNLGDSVDVQSVDWWNIPVTLVQSILYAALILLIAKVMKIDRFTRPPVAAPPSPVPADPTAGSSEMGAGHAAAPVIPDGSTGESSEPH